MDVCTSMICILSWPYTHKYAIHVHMPTRSDSDTHTTLQLVLTDSEDATVTAY